MQEKVRRALNDTASDLELDDGAFPPKFTAVQRSGSTWTIEVVTPSAKGSVTVEFVGDPLVDGASLDPAFFARVGREVAHWLWQNQPDY